MSIREWLALDKLSKLVQIIKWNGGLKASFVNMHLRDTLKIGCLAGIDQFGNKYYENKYYFFGRNRWVEYNPKVGYDYDASMIPPEWFGWMHYRTDLVPCQDPNRPNYAWIKPHEENMTGTPNEYVPYDTTRPKIEAWKPETLTNQEPNCPELKCSELKCSELKCQEDPAPQNKTCK